jgi:hypothetical protein
VPSSLISHSSGVGVQLYSGGFGTPWSGKPNQPRGLMLYLPPTQSGGVWIGFSGSAVAMTSGGALGTSGELDGFPMFAGDRLSVHLPAGGVESLRISTGAGSSGIRLYWDDAGNFGI